MVTNIFVVGLEDFDVRLMQPSPDGEEYAVHRLLDSRETVWCERYPMDRLLDRARDELRRFPGSVDAIVGYWDFPTTALVQILRDERGLPGPSLDALLKCEHKYWSRKLQQEAIPEHTPRFVAFDPFAPDPRSAIDLEFPFWVKPVKAHSSHLGFRVENGEDFRRAIDRIRSEIWRFAEPFNYVLRMANLPEDIAAVDGYHCLAEEIVEGRQCTLEGYVADGEPVVYGTVDSHRAPHCSSFTRYQYPSSIPEWLLRCMAGASSRLMAHFGYDRAPFNIEWFYDEARGKAWLLEVNPRISKSHAPLFGMVDGTSHQQVALDLALGRRPSFPHRQGAYSCAAKFMVREWRDAVAVCTPTPLDIAAAERRVPDAHIEVAVRPGMRLSELQNQDSYSYETALIYIGGHDEADVLRKYEWCLEALPFKYATMEETLPSPK